MPFSYLLIDMKDWNKTADSLEHWHFGNTPQMAEELLELVLSGKKTGTSLLKKIYDIENAPIPKKGDQSVVINSHKKRACIIEDTNVEIIAFKDVTPSFAASEGEGDLSLEYWRRVHESYFKQYVPSFTVNDLVVCETIKVVHRFI